MLIFLRKFKYLDLPLLLAVFLLNVVGLALLYSTSISSESLSSFNRQVVFVVFGWVGFLFFCFFDYHTVARGSRILYIFCLLALLFVLLLGPDIRGGRRWINLGFFNFQPAEFIKLVVILGLSRILYLQRGQINSIKNIFKSLLYVLIPVGLVLLEPDLGSAAVILGIWLCVLIISQINKKFVAALLLLCAIFSLTAWNFLLKDFQKDRIRVFLDQSADLRGQGYNVRQAVVAVGSGGLWGKGLGKGPQSQNRFLPERQTDFIFAASAEQIGLLGSHQSYRILARRSI
ncbi:MAG: FtsW/RodA/SpoVE family cell cycle protein [Candidatus Doudnabacteria bacterium]|nr:FtsW/RodA/SpoVE family cell cycle protein [Candidatus Doudnabacteria bacterium]